VLGFGVGVGDALGSPHLAQGAEQRFVGRAGLLEDRLVGEREQEMLGRDVLVLEPLGFAFGLLEVLAQRLAQIGLSTTTDLGESFDGRHERGLRACTDAPARSSRVRATPSSWCTSAS